MKTKTLKWFLVLPTLLIMGGMGFFFCWVVTISLFNSNIGTGEHYFVGISNYVSFVRDADMLRNIINTFIYTGGSVGIGFFISLALAKALGTKRIPRSVIGILVVLIILPWLFPKLAAGIMWVWMFNQLFGIVNYILHAIGIISEFQPFLARPATAFPILVWVDIWHYAPFAVIVLFGGFMRVNQELVDVARVDGAGSLQVFRHIEIPCILPEILVVLVLRTIWTFREFAIPYLVTGGGPGRSTETLSLQTYTTSITLLDLGMGSTTAVVMLALSGLLVFVYFGLLGAKMK